MLTKAVWSLQLRMILNSLRRHPCNDPALRSRLRNSPPQRSPSRSGALPAGVRTSLWSVSSQKILSPQSFNAHTTQSGAPRGTNPTPIDTNVKRLLRSSAPRSAPDLSSPCRVSFIVLRPLQSGADGLRRIRVNRDRKEAAPGFAPRYNGSADRRLTAWLSRQ